ncbi:hypothetical protein N665_0503s0020 [Sinapis alba]|nr:hypothetical protein N665_0503s0020 [Sinapis alba]
MNKINGLSDDLLVKILSFLPTKVAISTSILSKRWECVWMWLQKLEYVSSYPERKSCKCLSDYESSLQCFLERSMPLHRASVIESFRLELAFSGCKPEDIKLWIVIAVSRFLRELDVSYLDHPDNKNNILPSSLYASKSLVILKLKGNILLDVPRMVSLPSLKTLQLQDVKLLDGESFRKLLSICPVLENLSVKLFGGYVNIGKITVTIPSLLSLSLEIPFNGLLDGLVIDTPSLKYLKLEDYDNYNHSCLIEDMPQLEEAYLDVKCPDIERLIGSITSVKRLTLSSEAIYRGRFVFNQLGHLELCVGTNCASSLLVRLLEDSPNLRELDLIEMDHKNGYMAWWNQPDTVPKCILSSLQSFSWSGYYGIPQDKDIMVYILTNACKLKTVTISSDNIYTPKYDMIKELSLSYRASTACRLVFD